MNVDERFDVNTSHSVDATLQRCYMNAGKFLFLDLVKSHVANRMSVKNPNIGTNCVDSDETFRY